MLYSKYCKSCHGSKGLGNGSKALELKTLPGDFSTAEFQAYTDGEIYYMVTVGRDEMKSYSKKIPDDEDLWGVISYLRTFKNKLYKSGKYFRGTTSIVLLSPELHIVYVGRS